LKANLFNNILKEVSFALFIFLLHPRKTWDAWYLFYFFEMGLISIYEVLILTRCLYCIFVASPLDEPSRSNKKCLRLHKQIYSGEL
jgi:hypothetical protein